MKITKDNYEAFLLDRAEGTLSADLEKELTAFLIANPEIDPDHHSELPEVVSEITLNASVKEALKQDLPPISLDRASNDDLLVAYLEGDLTGHQRSEVETRLDQDESFARDWKLYQLTKLGGSDEVYNDKRSLKKGGVVIPLFRTLAIAASIALLFGTFLFFNLQNTNVLAEDTPPTEESVDPIEEVGMEPSPEFVENSSTHSSDESETPVQDASVSPTQVPPSSTHLQRGGPPAKEEHRPIRLDKGPKKLEARSSQLAVTLGQVQPIGLGSNTNNTTPVRPSVSAPAIAQEPDYTVSEFVASVFRKEILDTEEAERAELGRSDAVAMVDRGLRSIANGRASFNSENEGERRRWGIRLGNINLEADLAQ